MTAPASVTPEPTTPEPSLVAAREDSTTATSGVALVETGGALLDAIESGSWRDGALAGVGFGIEAAAAVLDPLGALVAAGVGWLMEHVRPLSDLLDQLTGDPDAVAAQARTWRNVAGAVRAAGDDTVRAAAPAPDWSGDAADAFSRAGADRAEEMRAGALVADALGAAVDGAGAAVSLVREIVRELIAQLVATLVARVPQWTLEEVGTLGIATPHVVAAASAVVAKVTRQVVHLVEGLTRSLRALGALVTRVLDLARRLFPRAPRPTPPVPAPTVAAGRTTPDPTPLPDHPFGPGTGSRPLPEPPATAPLPRAAPTVPARAPAPSGATGSRPGPGRPYRGPIGPSGAPSSAGPPPDTLHPDLTDISRIREALEGPLPARPGRPLPTRPPTAAERAAHEQRLDRLAAENPERYDDFSRNDPDHRGRAEPTQQKEAKIGLDMIDSGRWSPDVRRPTDSGDFYDPGTGRKWDIKGFHSEWPDHVADRMQGVPFREAITRERFESVMEDALSGDVNILLDIRKVDAEALWFMKDAVTRRGWTERVEWYP